MKMKTFHVSWLVLAAIALSAGRAGGQEKFVKFEVPRGMIELMSREDMYPHTHRAFTDKNRRQPSMISRAHEGGNVVLDEKQVLIVVTRVDSDRVADEFEAKEGFDITDLYVDLNWLDAIPADRLRGVILHVPAISDKGFARLKRFTDLTRVSVTCYHDLHVAALVESCPQLDMLEISYDFQLSDTPDASFEHPGKLKHLRRYSSEGRIVDDKCLSAVATWPKLEALGLSSKSKITDKGLKELTKAPALQELSLWLTPGITNEGLIAMAEALKLDHLILYGAERLDKETIAAIQKTLRKDGLLELKSSTGQEVSPPPSIK
jgi:hypothetical protein